jgi:hypothetical protein
MRSLVDFGGFCQNFYFICFTIGLVEREFQSKRSYVRFTITQKVKSDLSIGKGKARRLGFHLVCDTHKVNNDLSTN